MSLQTESYFFNTMALKMEFELIHRASKSAQENPLEEEEALILFISVFLFFHRCQYAFYILYGRSF